MFIKLLAIIALLVALLATVSEAFYGGFGYGYGLGFYNPWLLYGGYGLYGGLWGR